MDADAPPSARAALDDEVIVATVDLQGEDALYVTPTRTLHYQSEGLLSEESVAEYAHSAERVTVSEGRRKATVTFDYGPDGERALTVPVEQIDQVLHPVLAGVLSAADVTVAGETITRTYRFSELTLVVTSHRVVKHVGAAAWTADYETIPYESVRRLDVEDGDVAARLVLETERRIERIKVPTEAVRDVREQIQTALLASHEAATYEEFRRAVQPAGEGGAGADADAADGTGSDRDEDARSAFESPDLDPIDPDPDSDPDADTGASADAGDAAADPGPPEVGERQSESPVSAPDESVTESSATDVPIDADADTADASAPNRADSASGSGGAGKPGSDAADGDRSRTGGSAPGRAVDAAELAARLEELEAVVDRQAKLLAEQRELLAALADALNRDRNPDR
jgi:hypothetical protein